jgi:WhiB family transcriptional regulator, redox-sensing transcriptional regulator
MTIQGFNFSLPETARWTERAACAGSSVYMFPAENDMAGIQRAKNLCHNDCPVREACLTEALERRESHGVWGGLTPSERNETVKAAQGVMRAIKALKVLGEL